MCQQISTTKVVAERDTQQQQQQQQNTLTINFGFFKDLITVTMILDNLKGYLIILAACGNYVLSLK
jgi:hypothetical protein